MRDLRPVLIFLMFLSAALPGRAQIGASATWRVQKYDLNVTLPDAVRNMPVKATLTVVNGSSRPAGTLTLRLTPSAEGTAAKINGSTADFSKGSEEKVNAAISLQRVVLRFPAVAPGGTVNASLEYKLNVRENSGVAAISPLGAQFLPTSFWYPTPNSWYFARGADAAPVQLTVSAAGQKVASAGAEVAGGFDSKLNGQPFFVTGNWDVSSLSGVSVYAPKDAAPEAQKRAAELAALFTEARTFYAGILGKPSDEPLRIVSSRRGSGFSSAGTVIVDEAVFRRSKIDSLTAMNIAEAAAKLWLGGAVAISGDGHGAVTEVVYS